MALTENVFSKCSLGIGLLILQTHWASAQAVRYETVKGKIRIEGTSNIDDWQVESRSIAGYLSVDADFPGDSSSAEPNRKATPSRAEVFVDVLSLKSVEKDGKPFSNLMDEIMHAKLKAKESPRILYGLKTLALTAAPKTPDDAYRFESSGELVVAGVTNQITMRINVVRLDGQRLRISGNTAVRMTDFRIDPPAPKIALGIVKTGDEVKLSFEWVVAEASRSHSAATAEGLPR
jgi:hypothetical protein